MREPMPQFLKHYMIRKYGLKSIALKNLANLAAGVRQESCNSERLRVFGKITGMLDPHGFRENESNLVLVGLRHLYHINEIHFRMEAHPRVALSSVSAATLAGVPNPLVLSTLPYTLPRASCVPNAARCVLLALSHVHDQRGSARAPLAAFTCKYYFADEDDIIRVDGAPMLHPEVRAQLAALAAKTEHLSDALSRGASADHSSRTMSCNAHSDEAEVDLDLWLAWLLGEYEESLANAEHYFHGLYPKFDLNKDQTLDLHEFTNLIHHVDPSKVHLCVYVCVCQVLISMYGSIYLSTCSCIYLSMVIQLYFYTHTLTPICAVPRMRCTSWKCITWRSTVLATATTSVKRPGSSSPCISTCPTPATVTIDMYACVCVCVPVNNTPCLFQTLSLEISSAEMSKWFLFNAAFDDFRQSDPSVV